MVHALQFVSKILLSMGVALPFFMFLHAPHIFRGQFVLPVLATLFCTVPPSYLVRGSRVT